jgi:hypothetical protein
MLVPVCAHTYITVVAKFWLALTDDAFIASPHGFTEAAVLESTVGYVKAYTLLLTVCSKRKD